MSGEPVYCNVYDMTEHNKYTYPIGLGIFHSAIQIYGKEYSFGGHDTHLSGIFCVSCKTELAGTRFRESIRVGETRLSRRQVEMLVLEMGVEYAGKSYNIISKNCNHFTSDFSRRLCQRAIPGWINRLAFVGSYFSCILPVVDFGPVPVQPDDRCQASVSNTPRT